MVTIKIAWLILRPLIESLVFLPLLLVALVLIAPVIWALNIWEEAHGRQKLTDRTL